MYHRLPLTLTPEQVDRFRHLAHMLDIAPGPGGSRMSAHEATKNIFEENLTPILPPPWAYVTVVALYPGAQIQAHADANPMATRHHIPLQLNEDCWVFSDGVWQQLKVGRIYTMDPTKPHGAVNWGPTLRLHLLVDVIEQPS